MTDNNISEERTAPIIGAAQNIAQDLDVMRQNLVAVAKALHPIAEELYREFGGDSYMFKPNSSWADSWHLFLNKSSEWELQVAIVDREHEHEEYIAFECIPRWMVAEVVKHLPDFIDAYCAEIERRLF